MLREGQKQYLEERGFQVVEGEPQRGENFPYVTLRNLEDHEHPGMFYHLSDGFGSDTFPSAAHPSRNGTDKLVELIESSVARNISMDGSIFTTKPGNPIKVFVVDPAWTDVVTTLTEKYQ